MTAPPDRALLDALADLERRHADWTALVADARRSERRLVLAAVLGSLATIGLTVANALRWLGWCHVPHP